MKPSCTLALLAVSALLAPLAHADVVNRVTLSGSVVTVGEPITRTTGSGTTIVTKLVTQKITNATVLGAMVANGDLADSRGYGLVEIFTDEGVSTGFFARNTRTGDTVPVTEGLLTRFTNTNLIVAESSSSHTGPTGTVETSSTSFTGSADSVMSGTPVSIFVLGQTAGRNFTNRVAGQVVKVPYTSTTYTGLLRGVSSDNEVINAKLISTGSVYVLPAN